MGFLCLQMVCKAIPHNYSFELQILPSMSAWSLSTVLLTSSGLGSQGVTYHDKWQKICVCWYFLPPLFQVAVFLKYNALH